MTTLSRVVVASCVTWLAWPGDAGARPHKSKPKRKARSALVERPSQPAPDAEVAIVTDDFELATSPAPPPRPVHARGWGFYFRAGMLHEETNPGDADMKLPIATAMTGSGGVVMQESQIPFAMIVGYTLPVLDRRLALETILGFPTHATFQATGSLATDSLAPTFAGIPTGIPALGTDLGEATYATPILTAVYRVRDLGPVTPLVGAGATVLYAYDQKITNPVLLEAGQPTLDISPAVGYVVQGGLEARLGYGVTARIDAKYVLGMTVDAKIEHISVIPKAIPGAGPIDVGTATVAQHVTPFVIQAGVGTDF